MILDIKLHDIVETYNKIKNLAIKSYNNGYYESSLNHIETAADIAYKFNWIYTDTVLEKLLKDISSKVITQKNFKSQKGHIVFYDVFCLENRGLTQQYIRALISWGVELLYIYDGGNLDLTNNIIVELKAYPKAEILSINEKISKINKIKVFNDAIVKFQPEKAFLHLGPSSSMAVCLWNTLHQVTRYQVNLTDHAFWLGTNCIDYCLEFRNYGYTVSSEKRGLKKEQCLMQPFYPITECGTFEGFPSIVKDESIVVFTGGAYYKMYGENDTFFKIIKKILQIDPNIVFLIAGGGNEKPLINFILKNRLQNRIALIGSRKDINFVFKKSDIYLSTFPITGGLMGQFAAINKKPILSYSSFDIRCNFTEGFLNWGSQNWKVTHTNFDSFFQEAKKLINDEGYRKQRGNEANKYLITKNEFNSHLKHLINANKNTKPPIKEDINYTKFTNLYIDCENNYTPSFYSLIISRFQFKIIFIFPAIFIKAILSKQFYKKVLNKIIAA
jgi:glycosyltransferase involved in cell wall biosynthesis